MSRLLARLQRRELEQMQARIVRQALAESDAAGKSTATRAAAGDPDALRGIPVVGVRGGRGGAIKGTQPGRY